MTENQTAAYDDVRNPKERAHCYCGCTGCGAHREDSALALVARQVSAAIEAQPAVSLTPRSTRQMAWADGYTQACIDIRAAIRGMAT